MSKKNNSGKMVNSCGGMKPPVQPIKPSKPSGKSIKK